MAEEQRASTYFWLPPETVQRDGQGACTKKSRAFFRVVALWLPIACLLMPCQVQGQGYVQADALRGLKSVSVSVSLSATEGISLDTAAIRTSVEVELRRDGIPIADTPSAYLDVVIVPLKVANGAGRDVGYAVAMEVKLRQVVAFPASPTSFAVAFGWTAGIRLGVTPPDDSGLLKVIQDNARQDTELFANDWLKVHQLADK